ncbi:hypothetical protein GCM10020367_34360 [Streptomyces sannanensis]|uniref:GNAT family N-acetyltransferase n=1 Tax=Streptomyces sannanensis TaxID=285536 RepID=A0ABP6SCY4_9ACTN
MNLTVERTGAREWSDEQLEMLFAGGFPQFITADQTVKQYIGRVREWFGDLDLMLIDEHGVPVATGWGVPLRWDERVESLPTGYTDSLVRAVEGREQGVAPDTLVICGAIVAPALKGKGLAGEVLLALRQAAEEAGWPRVIAPVRPTAKCRYPLTPIEMFMEWTRPDGTAFDPWVRTHLKLGGRILAAAPVSQTMTGTVAEWEKWTGTALPGSGEYVIPDGMSPLHIDRDADLGTYTEPNIWIRHR